MPENTFRVHLRFASFLSALKSKEFKRSAFLFHAVGWLISYVMLVIATATISDLAIQPFLIIHGYFWFKLIGHLRDAYSPPTELLVLLFLFFFNLEALFLRSLFDSTPVTVQNLPGGLPNTIQIFLLAFLILVFSIILVNNSKGNRGVIFWYAVLGYLGRGIIAADRPAYLFLFQVFLFLLLLQKTSWLEELTQTECYVYFVLFFLLARWFSGQNPFALISTGALLGAHQWYSAPYYVFLLFKLYLYAVVVKIPVVLVYNHARLARKLWISGLFQSTFPQLIQLLMLLLLFYFFVASWQAEKVRESLVSQIEKVKNDQTTEAFAAFVVAAKGPVVDLQFKGYRHTVLKGRMPAQGVLGLERAMPDSGTDFHTRTYLVFFKTPGDSIYFIEQDSRFLAAVAHGVPLIVGTELTVYPYDLAKWESYLYSVKLWSEKSNFRIFPFGLLPQKTTEAYSTPFAGERPKRRNFRVSLPFSTNDYDHFTVGRVLTPILDETLQEKGFLAYDIVLIPDFVAFYNSPIFRYIIYFAIIYLIVNSLIIRRVVRFGTEINQMIVQKFNQLKTGIREISSGNLDYKVKLEGQDEFVELADRFNKMGDKLKETIAEVREKDRLEHELNIARQVQLSLLPLKLPEVKGFEVAAMLKTATEVGGDFYDLLPLDDHRFLFTVGDVSGKSTSAAFYMAQCISLIRFSPQFTNDPQEIAVRLNEYFSDPLVDRQMFLTAIVGLLDAESGTIRMVRAGHTLPFFVPGQPAESIQVIRSDGLGIGLVRGGDLFGEKLETKTLSMNSGDVLVFYTDGVIEASRPTPTPGTQEESRAEFYGEDRLQGMLSRLRSKTAWQILQDLGTDLEAFYSGKPPSDDYTLLIIKKSW